MKPWTTDGCSDFGFNSQVIAHADSKLAADILIACYWHDFGYWKGGPLSERDRVDTRFYNDIYTALCAWEKREREESDPYDVERLLELVDNIYFKAVRFGGAPWWPTPFRWGHGHRWLHWWAPADEELEDAAYIRLTALVAEARKAVA